jgi:hypothetical protein
MVAFGAPRFVRAIALPNSTDAASPWSARVDYRVVP